MLRVAVIGTSCSGKTTLARRIAEVKEIPHIELDAINWGANWMSLPLTEFRTAVREEVARNEWVIDGNYSKLREIIWLRATHLIWLNLPFLRIFWHALSRTVKRVVTREELWAGNTETFPQVIFDRDSILWWVIRSHRRRSREYHQLIEDGTYPHLIIHEIRNNEDIEEVLLKLGEDEVN